MRTVGIQLFNEVNVHRSYLRRTLSFVVVSLALLGTALPLGVTGVRAQAAPEPTNVELILDASGSMFNRLEDGRYRIVAAKEVLADLIAGLPDTDGLNVGLRVYGSSMRAIEPGACEDTVLKVGVDGFARQELLDTVKGTQALGATPIALSLEQAADDFPDDGRNVIVLITDGIESCRGDLREVAQMLADRGIDLRIVGFDLADTAAQSFAGLGTFENARSAAELLAALTRAVEIEAVATTYPVTVRLTRDGATTSDGATVTFTGAIDSEVHPFTSRVPGEFSHDLATGSYTASVADAFSTEPLRFAGLVVTAEGPNVFAFELAPVMSVTLSVDSAENPAGAVIDVAFSGAPQVGGYVTLSPVDTDVSMWLYSLPAEADSQGAGVVRLRLPDMAGDYELRYLVDLPEGGRDAIGRLAVRATAVEASLTVPSEAQAGSSIDVAWTGPGNEDDFITLVPAGTEQGSWASWSPVADGNPISVKVPDTAGEYEVRYVSGGEYLTLASAPLQVGAADATLSAAETAPAGSLIAVSWTGPGNEEDFLTIVPVGTEEGTWNAYATLQPGDIDVRTSDYEGEYEIRYITGGEYLTLARRLLTVTPLNVTIEAPATAQPDAEFEVTVSGPYDQENFLTILPAGTEDATWDGYFSVYEASVTLYAPSEPGEYVIRYITGQEYRTLREVPLSVR